MISNHQHSIVLGVRKALPGVKHQFCHFHVLRNALMPIADMNRGMKKDIRGIKGIEGSLPDRDNAIAPVIGDSCSLLRALPIYPGTSPLEFSGMGAFRKLTPLDGTMRRMLPVHRDRELDHLVRITWRWREFTSRYRDTAYLARYASNHRRILSLNITSGEAMKLMEDFPASIRTKMLEGRSFSSLSAMTKTLENHWDELF